MSAGPFEFVRDAPLFIVPRTLDRLRAFRAGPKLADLPGANPSAERDRLALELDRLTDRLLSGIEAHPTKVWVLAQFGKTLEAVQEEDTEAREHMGGELERLMAILGIESSDGVLAYYLGGM